MDAKLARRRDAGPGGDGGGGGGSGGGGGAGERSVVMDVWEPVAAACTGAAPGLCRGLVRWIEANPNPTSTSTPTPNPTPNPNPNPNPNQVRWIEATLDLPVWLPVEMAL